MNITDLKQEDIISKLIAILEHFHAQSGNFDVKAALNQLNLAKEYMTVLPAEYFKIKDILYKDIDTEISKLENPSFLVNTEITSPYVPQVENILKELRGITIKIRI